MTCLQDAIVVDGLLGPGPPFLAQLAVERSHVDLDGQERVVALAAAGTGWDPETARLRCWAEMVERFTACSPQVVARVVEERPVGRDDVLPWWAFASYDAEQVRRLDRSALAEHDFVCSAERWGSAESLLVPASRVILGWADYAGPDAVAGECDASGLAAGCSRDDAALRGLREVLERDAAMQAWHCPGWPGRVLEPAVLGAEGRRWLSGSPYEVRFADVARPGLDPVVVAMLYDEAGATVGTACAENLPAAADAALREAAMLRSTVDVLGPGDASTPVRTSLDHIRHGYQHPEELHQWFDGFTAWRGAADRVRLPLPERVAAVFGVDTLVVELATSADAPFAVVRTLVPGATRKEWRHEPRCDARTARGVVPSSTRHDFARPFG